MTHRLPLLAAALAALAWAGPAAAQPAGGEEAVHVFPRPFDATRAAAIDAMREVASDVAASTAHLEGVLPAVGGAPATRIEAWLRTVSSGATEILVRIARPVAPPIVPPGETSADAYLRLVALRLGVPPPRRAGGASQVYAPPPAVPEAERPRGGYGWALGPVGEAALRVVVAAGFEHALRSAAFADPATGAIAYAHLGEGLRLRAGVAIPNDAAGRLDTTVTAGVQVETGARALAWRSFPVEIVETWNAGPVRVGVGAVEELGARAAGRDGRSDVAFGAWPGAVARLGVVVPTGRVRGPTSALVVSADAVWSRLRAEGRSLDAASVGVDIGWMF